MSQATQAERVAHQGAFDTNEQSLRLWIALQPKPRKPRKFPKPTIRKFSFQ